MRKDDKKFTLSFPKVLELIGKPAFFVFTILLSFCYFSYLLLRKFLHSLRIPSLSIPKLSFPRANPKYLYVTLIFCVFVSLTYWYIFRDLPSVRLLSDTPPSLTTKIYDRHGVLLYQIYKDENRTLIQLSDLPSHLINATLAAEDKNFYHHLGISATGISRAFWNNLSSSTLQGGSTITQQLVKNVLLTPEKSWNRKLKEIILALEAEIIYSKDQILEMYFNQIGYGGTAYGIEEASRQYFGVSARDLSLSQSTMLAGLPVSPTTLSPFGINPYLAKVRQQQVLESMVTLNMITENDKVTALTTPLVFHPQSTTIRAPHFVMYVKDLLVKQYGEAVVARGGLVVTTTLDLSVQDILQTEINAELDHLAKLHVQNGAGLVISPKTGEILAMVGSRDFFDTLHDGQVNVALQPRQPGSAIKPLTYALALSSGLTPYSKIDDSPVCFIMRGSPDYCPKNYDGLFHGQVTLRTALASSYNIPAIKLLNSLGVNRLISLAEKLGITTWTNPERFGLSLTLGGGEITMLDLASVYSVFANGGIKIPFTPILSISDSTGTPLPPYLPAQAGPLTLLPNQEVLSPSVAYQITSILSDPLARAPAFGTHSILNLPGPGVAVKTGTTNALRDNWTFGYTPNLLIATWVGNNDNTPMSSVASGVTGASPIWARTMKFLLGDAPSVTPIPPDSLVKVNVSCTNHPKYEYFTLGTVPKINCSPPPGTLLESAASTSSPQTPTTETR